MRDGTRLTLDGIPLRFDGTGSLMDWYTILIPGKETSFIVKQNSDRTIVSAKAKMLLAGFEK